MKTGNHWSNCSLHNMPAMPNGHCDCGADAPPYTKCECGCEVVYVPANEKAPQNGICAGCRKDVDLRGSKLELTR